MSETAVGAGAPAGLRPGLVIGCLLTALLSVPFGLLLMVNLVLVQFVFYKAGPRNAMVCGVISLALMTGACLLAYRFLVDGSAGTLLADLATPLALYAPLVLLNLRWRGVPAWARVLAGFGLANLIQIPLTTQLLADPTFSKILADQINAFLASSGADLGAMDPLAVTRGFVVRFGGLSSFLCVLYCWHLATWFHRRRPIQWTLAMALANFRVAEYMVWPLLASLALFGAGRLVAFPGSVDVLVTVALVGMVLLYLLHGLGIIATWLGRLRKTETPRPYLPLVLAILLLVPGPFLVLIPLLGVMEIWIRMRPATHETEAAAD